MSERRLLKNKGSHGVREKVGCRRVGSSGGLCFHIVWRTLFQTAGDPNRTRRSYVEGVSVDVSRPARGLVLLDRERLSEAGAPASLSVNPLAPKTP